jgi:RHS repeat-associated protein
MSLQQVAALARQAGMKFQTARREAGASFIVPSVVHYKVEHYAALVERRVEDGREYFLVENPLFERMMWVSRAALEAETSGYFLVPEGRLPDGWRKATHTEAISHWGRCFNGTKDTEQTRCEAVKVTSGCQTCGCKPPGTGQRMAQYSFHAMLASLNIVDEPVGYLPPRGPGIGFITTYNQRDAFLPATFSFSNLGPKWTFDWLSFVTDEGAEDRNQSGYMKVYLRGGGQETYLFYGPDPLPRSGGIHYQSQAELVLVSFERNKSAVYERRLPDGSREIFSQAELVARGPRRIFLTQIVDPAGNTVRLTYDSQMRIVAVTDAIGQVTTLAYELPGDPLKITRVTDPFGRAATFSYDSEGRLIRITDVAGITSEFTYVGGDFISSLKTPYGATTFRAGPGPEVNSPKPDASRFLQATDPFGETERLETYFRVPNQPGELGVGYYWNKRAWQEAPSDYAKARLFRWMLVNDVKESGMLRFDKPALESMMEYSYPKQKGSDKLNKPESNADGLPISITRTLDDGTRQTSQFQYNNRGQVTQMTDPAGRRFSFAYADNQLDLLEAYNDKTSETLVRLNYNSQHLPLTYTDASGQTTSYTYNTQGQLTTVTNPKGETTTLSYNNNGYLLSVTGPIASATTSFSWDDYGRVRTVTDSEGYLQTFDYDALDRPTRVTYPDGTFEQITYDRLDAVEFKDRLGRVTKASYDALQRLTSVTDPLGRVTRMEWCNCGDLARLHDPKGNVTAWTRDLQGRVLSKKLADGTETRYAYEKNTSRLKQIVDARGQTVNYQYGVDDNLQQMSFGYDRGVRPPRTGGGRRDAPSRRVLLRSAAATSATNQAATEARDVDSPIAASLTTPTITFTWDANYNRLANFQDGTGTTAYSYHSANRLGALQIAALDGPLENDTINYGYDELGRVVNRTLNGAATSLTYDALGRVTNEVNRLGAFVYAYVNATSRLQSVRYPNGQTTAFSYFTNAGDQRLRQIQHLAANQSLLSQFDYTYLATGEIQSVTRQTLAGSSTYSYSYDLANQLTGAVANGNPTLTSYAYAYDPAGNRASEQLNSALTLAVHNNTNQLLQQQQGDTTRQFIYDASGNLLSAGARSFEWDALDRLVAITAGSHRTEFSYDALDRRTRIVEKENDVIVSDKRLVWCGEEICEERDVTSSVTKRFLAQGETEVAGGNEAPYFYTKDHLGSVREMTDRNGNLVVGYDYDPFGRMTKTSVNRNAAFGYAGYFTHTPSGLNLTKYRAYDAGLGRWLSRDPIEEDGGLNLYGYVGNNPPNITDPSGLGYFIVGYGYAGHCGNFARGDFIPFGHVEYVTDAGRVYQMTIQGLQIIDAGVPASLKTKPFELGPIKLKNPAYRIDPFYYDDRVIEKIFNELKPGLGGPLEYLVGNNCITVAQQVRRRYYEITGKRDYIIEMVTPAGRGQPWWTYLK